MDESCVETRERILILEERSKNQECQVEEIHKKLEEIEKTTKTIQELVIEIKHMREDLEEAKKSLKLIEEKPAKRFELIITSIISTIAGCIATAAVMVLTQGG